MKGELERLKSRFPLLDYLRELNWTARRVGSREEHVGLCPLHAESRPSFYVNARKNLFYCHGCGRGGDLIRFVQLYFGLDFRETVAHLKQQASVSSESELLDETAAFYQFQLHRHREAVEYLQQRGIHEPYFIEKLGVGYAPGGCLRRHLTELGHSIDLLRRVGLVNEHGRDTFCRRIVFPWRDRQRTVNLYGRSIGAAAKHRFLRRPKGGLFAWETVHTFRSVILVEGLFDLAALWQAGFPNTTCALGTHLTQTQLSQLCDAPNREVFLVLDQDANYAGQKAACRLAQRLGSAGVRARLVELPPGHDPNSYFASGATAADFRRCLAKAPAR